MIVIDTSAFVCIATTELDFHRYVEAVRLAPQRVMSAGNYLEAAMIGESRLGGRAAFDRWLRDEVIQISPVDRAIAELAADAFVRFGKGRHPAALNYGDCFAYALAKSLRAPLLYKRRDFALTDIEAALPG